MRKGRRCAALRWIPVLLVVLAAAPAARAQGAAAQGTATLEERLDELALGTRVRLALLNDDVLEPFQFEIYVRGAAVTVHGQVQTPEQRSRVEAIASRLRGVESVVNAVVLADGALLDAEAVYDVDLADVDVDALDPLLPLDPDQDPDVVPIALVEPQGSGAEEEAGVEADAESGPAGVLVPDGLHRVEEGDTLLELSERYGISISEIRRLNNLSRIDPLEPGRLLRVKEP